MSRSDALAAYEKLPLPDTTEEHWRFTNLRGFDPDSFEGAASAEIETMLDLDVAGYATVTADGIEIEKAPEGVTFAPLPIGSVVFRVPDVAAAREKLEAAGVEFMGESWDSRVCHGAAFKDPDGNGLALHHRYAAYPDGTMP